MFDFNKVQEFDNHIRLSIPNYDQLFNTFKDLASIYSEPDTCIIDFGCSTGKLLIDIPKKDDCVYIGVDNSSLVPNNSYDNDSINFYREDAIDFDKEGYSNPSSVVISMFFLQFLSKSKRAEMVKQLRQHVNNGAVLLIAEKVILNDIKLDNIISRLHMQEKRKNFTDTEILDKDRQILDSMYIVEESDLMDELWSMGNDVEVIKVWQSYNFCGYVVKK